MSALTFGFSPDSNRAYHNRINADKIISRLLNSYSLFFMLGAFLSDVLVNSFKLGLALSLVLGLALSLVLGVELGLALGFELGLALGLKL